MRIFYNLAFTSTLALIACDSGTGSMISTESASANWGDGGVASASERPCPAVNLTRSCQCPGPEGQLTGAQQCGPTGWTSCQCTPPASEAAAASATPGVVSEEMPALDTTVPAGNLRTDISFDWERTPASAGSCEPGDYEGTFQGVYFSSVTFGALPLPVASSGTPGRPGLAFTLEESGTGERLQIRDGWMVGTANSTYPFEASITGELDCTTLVFDAIMDGGYWTEPTMLTTRLNFKGPIVGVYDKATRTIQMGTWNLDEYNPEPPIPSGGEGTWQAGWQQP